MKPAFALSLSADGIALLYRAGDGWRSVGSTPFSAEDLPAALADMRADALRLAPDGVFSKLILPNDQIRYLTVETGELPAEERIAAARAALEGATPYEVDELAFDISADGGLTHIAAVALETLDEAETFAVEHGFGPASFVAAPEDSGFQGEPFFGTARAIRGTEVEPDSAAVEVVGPVKMPDPAAEGDQEDSPPAPAKDTAEPPKDTAAEQPAAQLTPAPQAESVEPAGGRDTPEHPQAPAEEPEPEAEPAEEEATEDAPATAAEAKTPASLPPAPPAPAADGSAQEGNGFSSIRSKAAPANSSAPPVLGPAKAPQPEQVPPPLAKGPQPAPAPSAAKPLGAAGAARPADQAEASAPQPKIPPAPAALREAAATPAPPPKEAAGKPAAKGKPRYLGVILTALLLLFMATVAVWAVFGESGFLSDTPAEDSSLSLDPEAAPGSGLPEDEDSPAETPAAAPRPGTDEGAQAIAPQVSVLADQPDPGVQETGLIPAAADEAAADGAELPGESADTAAVAMDAPEVGETEGGLQAPAPAAALEEPLDELAQAARYAATGVWPVAPDLGSFPAAPGLDELYTASIDQPDIAADAVALPQAESFAQDGQPAAITSPAAAGQAFELNDRGLVTASREGTLNPDGIMVYLGRPGKVPPRAPERSDPAAEALAEEVARNQVLSRKRPKPRPSDLEEQVERAQLGGLSRAELASLRPRQRPASLKPAEEEQMPATALAVAASVVPRGRPANFANLVDRARRNAQNQVQTAAAVPAAAAAAAPRIPTTASVARRATVSNAINLRKLNLIGVYGTASNRRALVRLPSGRYKKVQVGDRIDGGRVIAIGENQLQYQKSGRNRTLKMPNG
ncbi:hypothetical protein [Leisingera caerulea]|uniref:hypothetical protein n=1 Tax=Leisingera caerulea TaxID=506591 RepID=UPI0021A3BE78|nr:hypothetical protein [Leisingera caerulea]